MRVLELEIQDLRDFHGRHRLSFLDEAGSRARPVTAVVSADPRRRATALEAIEASISYAVDPRHPRGLVQEAFVSGWLQLSLELCAADLQPIADPLPPVEGQDPGVLRIELGRRGMVPLLPVQEWNTLLAHLAPSGEAEGRFTNAGALSSQLYTSVARMHRGAALHGGLLYFSGLTPTPEPASHSWLADVSQPWILRSPSAQLGRTEPLTSALDRYGRPGAVIAFEPPLDQSRPTELAALRDAARAWNAQLILALHPADLPSWLGPSDILDLDARVAGAAPPAAVGCAETAA